ncbi:TPA: hypothetical protein MYK71_002491 [Klebsiella quasipneumoniae subsp. quasipneumoniae]|nr:hypothetical protein [Klebsiella quasipneumoniae subsp. quasipneumoniae]
MDRHFWGSATRRRWQQRKIILPDEGIPSLFSIFDCGAALGRILRGEYDC